MRKQLTLFDDIRAPSNGVRTSDEAAEAIEQDGSRLRRLVFRTIEKNIIVDKSDGLTCQEVEKITRIKHETVSARIWELHTHGLLRDSGRTRLTKAKRKAIVWVVPTEPSELPMALRPRPVRMKPKKTKSAKRTKTKEGV